MLRLSLGYRKRFFALLLCGSVASNAGAQVLEEIIVTAQRRAENLQDVGISITAFSAQQLQNLALNNSNELVFLTPGLTLNNPGGEGNITSLTLRGIGQGDFNDHQESPVASYHDEVYNAYMGTANISLFDLERAEVLRGPQGTLFGRNATAGLVHFISRKPANELDGYLSLSLAENKHVRAEAAIGGPLGDALSVRLSGFVNQHDPIVHNISGPDGNEADTYALRGQLNLALADSFDALLKVEYARTDIVQWYHETVPAYIDPTDGVARLVPRNQNVWGDVLGGTFGPSCAGCDGFGFNGSADGDPFQVNEGHHTLTVARGASEPGLERDSLTVSAVINWNLKGNTTLTSVTAFQEHNKMFNQDSDGTPIEPVPLVIFATDTAAEQFSQEFRLQGETDSMRWTTGLYYLDYDTDILLDVGFFAPSAFLTDQLTFTKNWSVFGQIDYFFAANWTLTVGLRYLDEEKEMDADGSIAGFIAGLPMVPRISGSFNASVSSFAKLGESDVAGKVQLNFRPDDNILWYAGISRGVKAGGFNGVFGVPASDPSTIPYAAEKPISYEVGFKSTLLDGRAQWNTSAYYYDYQDYQAFAFLALQQRVFNADATVAGFDSELRLAPIDNLDVALGINVMETEAENIENGGGFAADRELPASPGVQFYGTVRYRWPAFNGEFSVQCDVSYQSESSFQIFNDPAGTIDNYSLGNVRVGFTSSDKRWDLSAFVKNVTNEEHVVAISNNSSFGHMQYFYGRPRWAGIQFQYRLN